MLDLKSLSYFIAAYEERSISAAALRCFIAQPSISYAIKNLEEKLKLNLFIRSRQGLKPTPQADQLYKYSLELLKQASQIEHSFLEKNDLQANIYFQKDISISRIEILIDHLRNEHDMTLNWVSNLNQSDLAIIDKELSSKRFTEFHLFTEGFQIIVPLNHPLSSKTKVTIADIHNQTFIERAYCSQRKQFQNLLLQNNIEIHLAAKADNDLQALDLVKLGFGVMATPRYRFDNELDGLIAIPVELPYNREVVLGVRSNRKELVSKMESINWQWVRSKLPI